MIATTWESGRRSFAALAFNSSSTSLLGRNEIRGFNGFSDLAIVDSSVDNNIDAFGEIVTALKSSKCCYEVDFSTGRNSICNAAQMRTMISPPGIFMPAQIFEK
ncbi:hypothetical protein ABIF20_003973 [Bradyrhizobium japonicum]